MKKLLFIAGAVLILMGCQKKDLNEVSVDKWNGYENFYKTGPLVKTLWAGQHHNVGTITYEFIEDGSNVFFSATYNTAEGMTSNNIAWEPGWSMSETHLFAGIWDDMPKNKPGNPKIGQFPFSSTHNPRVTSYTYTTNVLNLPNYDDPGFIVAAHAIVKKTTGQTETAWGDWDKPFADKGWGGYASYFYQEDLNPHTLFYGTEVDGSGNLNLYLIQINNDNTVISSLISSQNIGSPDAIVSGTAYDSQNLYYTIESEGTANLYIDPMTEEEADIAGILIGSVVSADYYNGNYFYVNDQNVIYSVSFSDLDNDGFLEKNPEALIATVPANIDVNSMAINPSSGSIYLIGVNTTNDALQLITYSAGIFYDVNTDVALSSDALISFGADDNLYAVTYVGGTTFISNMNPSTGDIFQIDDTNIGGGGGGIIDDLGRGPIQ